VHKATLTGIFQTTGGVEEVEKGPKFHTELIREYKLSDTRLKIQPFLLCLAQNGHKFVHVS
jgi:hypothetical protein